MKLKALIADYFSNNSFDLLREAYIKLQEENQLLRDNGIQQAKDLGSEIKRLTTELETIESASKNSLGAQQAELESAQKLIQGKEKSLKEAEEESELLLLQLHQVQEELESVFLKEQEAQQQLKEQMAVVQNQAQKLQAVTQEKTALVSSLDAQTKLTKEQQAKLEAVAKESSALALARDEQQKVAEAHLKQSQTLEAQLADLNAKNSGLAEQVNQSNAALEQLKESQAENELLLLQLHQVQEELEHYFLEFQRLQRENESFINRWQRLEDRLPNYLDFESIIPTAVDAVSETPKIEWLVKDVLVGGTIFPELKFVTFVENGECGIELLTFDEQPSQENIRLVPRALVRPKAVKAIADFRNLSSSDWRRIRVAVNCVEHFFKDPRRASNAQPLPENFDPVFWRQMAVPLIADINALPAIFRFDQVRLKRELVHSDYEHLWLEIHDATYGDSHWPKFELRLGAANIQPGAFSRYPKIEIPKIDGKTRPFASWFEESFDDFGGKLELRFDLNKQLFDLGVWVKLGNPDQMMLLSLIGGLPIMLKRLENDKTAIGRPWDSWTGLIAGLINVMRKRLDEAKAVLKQEAEKKQTVKEDTAQAQSAQSPPEEVSKEKGESALQVSSKETQKEDQSPGKSARYVGARPKKSRGR